MCIRDSYDAVTRTVADFRSTRPRGKVLYKADEILGRSLVQKPRPDFAGARDAFGRVIASPTGRKTQTAANSHLRMAETILLQQNFADPKNQCLAVQSLYNSPTIQAAALFQAAGCQEQLKEFGEAVRTLELLLKTYPESPFTSKAKTRLPRLRRLTSSCPIVPRRPDEL